MVDRTALSVCQAFKESLDNPPYSGITIKYNAVRVSSYYKHFIFVEGNSDKRFYGRTRDRDLSDKVYYLYADSTEEERGKTAVRKAYEDITNNSKLRVGKEKCIFIIDRDWDEAPGKPFRVTLGHSMENYFLVKENLTILFKALGKDESEIEQFFTLYSKFCKETADFWALKATVIYAYKTGALYQYRHGISFDEIFAFKYIAPKSDKNVMPKMKYNSQLMKEEAERMKQGIAMNADLVKQYKVLKKRIDGNPLLVRGHDAFHFLQCYIKGRYGAILDFYGDERFLLENNVPRFNVELK